MDKKEQEKLTKDFKRVIAKLPENDQRIVQDYVQAKISVALQDDRRQSRWVQNEMDRADRSWDR
jgi:transposase